MPDPSRWFQGWLIRRRSTHPCAQSRFTVDVSILRVRLPRALFDGSHLLFSYINESTSPFAFVWVSARPRVAYIPNFMTDDECDELVQKAAPYLARSMVAPIDPAEADRRINDVRTSHQTWLSVLFGTARTIADRIFLLTGFERGSSEDMQILRYGVSQKYDAHNDYFDPKIYGPQPTNRAVTVFLYLSDVDEGGETWFPNAMKSGISGDTTSCRGGLGVRPHKRSAVIFYDMTPTGGYDPWSLHGGCPVKKGTKWGGTLWLRVPT